MSFESSISRGHARNFELFVVDETGTPVRPLEGYTDGEFVMRLNDVGTWTLTIPRQIAPPEIWLPQHGVQFVSYDDTAPADGDTIMQGPIVAREWRYGRDVDVVQLGGVDDMVWLAARRGHPDPTDAYTPPSETYASAYDIRTGTRSTIARQYVDLNLGPGALTDRQVPGLTIGTDPVIGGTGKATTRFWVLLDVLRDIAQFGKLRYSIIDRVFNVHAVSDSIGPTFSVDFGTVKTFHYSEIAPWRDGGNHVVVGADGEAAARNFVEVVAADNVNQWGRMETFLDRRDLSDMSEAYAAGLEYLESIGVGAESVSNTTKGATFELVEGEQDATRWRTGWDLGTRARVIAGTVDFEAVITEINIRLRPNADLLVSPGVGHISTIDRDNVFSGIRSRTDASLRSLEVI